MNQKLVKTFAAMAIALSFGVAASTARADGGGGPIDSKDGRYSPEVGDRVAVYLQNDVVDVWGIDGNLNGVHLTTFTASEVNSGKTIVHKTEFGAVTLVPDTAPVTYLAYADDTATTLSTYVETPGEYQVMWSGAMGANGVGAFSKSFEAAFVE